MKLSRSTLLKLLAALMSMLCLAGCAVSTVLALVVYNYGGYAADASWEALYHDMARQQMIYDVYDAADYYALTTAANVPEGELQAWQEKFDETSTNFFFTIADYDTGEVLLESYTAEADCTLRMDFYVLMGDYNDLYDSAVLYYDDLGNLVASGSPGAFNETGEDGELLQPRHIIVTGCLRSSVYTVCDSYTSTYRLTHTLHTWRNVFLFLSAGGGVVGLGCLVFLLYGAGRRRGTEEISLRLIDRIPADLFLLLWGGVAFGGVGLFFLGFEYTLYQSLSRDSLLLLLFVSCCAAFMLVVLLSSFAARFKVKYWWRNTLVWKLWHWVGELFHHPLHNLWLLLKAIPLVWKVAVTGVALAIVELPCLIWFYDGFFLPMLVFNLAVALVVLYCAVCMARLRDAARAIADGDLDHPVDLRGMQLDFRAHGEDLGRISSSINLAVEERLKSERFKTELITNVSHDLKTPLTSIVNYVHLLSKLDLPADAMEYVEVLQRQSARLKKLTEDLVEASKASTGSLSVDIQPVRLAELLGQVTAEYADRFEAAGLHGVVELPDETTTVLGDGRYLWRIMDNLLSNVCKYAMPSTRVYISALTEGNMAVVSVKNISKERLNISADALMERFVRGDASRNTEGSGLGLSIAESLCQLMGGELRLTVDGDLFKAEVVLPLQ